MEPDLNPKNTAKLFKELVGAVISFGENQGSSLRYLRQIYFHWDSILKEIPALYEEAVRDRTLLTPNS